MNFLDLDLLSLPTVAAFAVMVLVNAAVTRVTVHSIKDEVEKLEKKLEHMHTQLFKISVLEARMAHLEKDLGKTEDKVDALTGSLLFKE